MRQDEIQGIVLSVSVRQYISWILWVTGTTQVERPPETLAQALWESSKSGRSWSVILVIMLVAGTV